VKSIIRVITLLFLLTVFVIPTVTAEISPLRVFYADEGKIASLAVVEIQETRYVLLEDVYRLFNGTIKSEPLIGRMTVTMRGKRIILTLSQNRLEIDGEEYALSKPPVMASGKAIVPVDFLTEILPVIIGRKITLDREDWSLHISRESFIVENGSGEDSQTGIISAGSGFRVIIDPGHGGYEVGARSRDGLLEKDLTLAIAQKMKELLVEDKGVVVYLTRSGDNYMAPSERVNFANKLRGQVYLSIHFNSSPSQISRGFGIYVNSNQARLGAPADDAVSASSGRFALQSQRFAKEIAERLEEMEFSGEYGRGAPLAAMNNLSMPGVLLEVLYLSSPQDLIILTKRDFIDSVSQTLCDSILDFRAVLEDKSGFANVR